MSLLATVILPLINQQLSEAKEELVILALKELKSLGHAVIEYVENHCLHEKEDKNG